MGDEVPSRGGPRVKPGDDEKRDVVGGESIRPAPGTYVLFGASGLIGSHVLELLADAPGVMVRAVVNSRAPHIQPGNMTVHRADLAAAPDWAALLEDADYAIQCAGIVASAPVLARDPVAPLLANARIANGVLAAARRFGLAHVVLMSSTTGYPDRDGDCAEGDFFVAAPPDSWRGLGWTYRYIEAVARMLAERVDDPIGVTALRPTLVYGARDSFDPAQAHFLPAFVRRVAERENPIEVWGDGTATRDLIHAEDVARAALLAMRHARPGFRAYNIGAGRQHSVNAILDRLLALDRYGDAQVAYRSDRPTSAKRRGISIARAATELGYAPAVDLETGLARTLAGYRATLRQAA